MLAAAAKADLTVGFTDSEFPEGYVRAAGLGYAPSMMIRHDRTGCGDWLVMTTMELARTLHDQLMRKGAALGAIEIGVRAWDSLRLERGTPVIGLDVDRTLSPAEAGLSHLVAADKGDFFGRDAMLKRRNEFRLVRLVVQSGDNDPYINDLVTRDGRAVGLVRSGGHAHLAGGGVAFAALPAELAADGAAFEVEIFGQRYPAKISAARSTNGALAAN